MPEPAAVIGLEVHAQLRTRAKLFCRCRAGAADAPPNANVCPVCTGQPGALPVINRAAVELGVKAGLALNCAVSEVSVFDRKSYFYPDLPKAYQITQYARPLCTGGFMEIDAEGGTKKIRLRRAHLEEDAGKLLHQPAGGGPARTLVDMNRCGVPLLEIVTEPDLNSADEAHACLSELRQLLQWTGVCGCDMEKGELRCDVNVSLRPGEGARTEIKNLNSFKAVRDAINHEIVRQTRALSAGGTVAADTRLWNEALRRTEPMRAKETAGDYRYFPEPDLPPLRVSREVLEAARQADCDLPRCARERFRRDFAMNAAEAGAVSASRELAAYAEACMRVAATLGLGAKPVMRILGGEFLARLNELKIPHAEIAEKAIKPEALARIAALAAAGKVSASAEKVIFAKAWETGRAPEELLKELGLAQVSDPERLKVWAGAAIAEEPEAAQAIRNGNDRAMGPLVAALMRKSGGSANPRLAAETIKELLS